MRSATDGARDTTPARGGRIDRPLALLGALAGAGAITVSSCCVLPLTLAAIGIGGGWLGGMGAFAAYRPVLLGLAGAALLAAWTAFAWRRRAVTCAADSGCAAPSRGWLTAGLLVLATLIVALAAILPTIENDVLGVLQRLQ